MSGKGKEASSRSLVGYAAQVVISHSLSATLAELVFRREGFNFPGVYGALEFATFAIAPIIFRTLWQGPEFIVKLLGHWDVDTWRYILCGVMMSVSHGAGLAAYCWINYTTAMLFGSAKLPSVMLVGAFLNRGASASGRAYGMALSVALGLCVFGFAEQRDAPRFNAVGLFLVAINLCLSSVTFNLQQQILHNIGSGARAGGAEASLRTERLMFFQYACAFSVCMLYAVVSGETTAAAAWCAAGRGLWNELSPILCGALLTSIGVHALLRTTAEFDAARAGLLTNCRKACTFILSFFMFPKPFSLSHFVGLALILGGSVGVHRALGSKPERRVINLQVLPK